MHKLQKQILKVDYYDETGVDRFYEKALHLLYQDISPEMERILDKHSETGKLIRINSLTVNLGLTYETELREQWVSRFKDEFEKELLRKLNQIKNGHGSEGESTNLLYADDPAILLFYLKNGALPWHADASEINISSLFDKILAADPAGINKRLREENTDGHLIRRLVMRFSDNQIERLIRVLQPSESTFIIQSAAEIRKAQQRDQIVKSDNRGFRDAIWSFILSYLLNDRGSYFSTREFTRSLLTRMANHFNIAYGKLIEEIYKSIHRLKSPAVHFRLGRLLQDIYQSDRGGKSNPVEKELRYRQIISYLSDGNAGNTGTLSQSFYYRGLFNEWMSDSPLGLRQFLFKKGNAGVLRRMVGLFPKKDLGPLINVISPAESTFIMNFNAGISGQQAELNWAGSGSEQFKTDLWIVMLDILLNDRGSVFSHKVFILATLEKLSKHYNLEASYFIAQILRLIEADRNSFDSPYLFKLFVEIGKDFSAKKRGNPDLSSAKIAFYFEYLESVLSACQPKGSISYHGLSSFNHLDKSEIIIYLLKKKPKSLLAWMRKKLATEAGAVQFLLELDLSTVRLLVSLLTSSPGNHVTEYLKILLHLYQSSPLIKMEDAAIELYQSAFVFLVTSSQSEVLEDRFLAFILGRTASKMSLKADELAKSILPEADKNPGLLSETIKSFLAKASGMVQTSAKTPLASKHNEAKKNRDDPDAESMAAHASRAGEDANSQRPIPGDSVGKGQFEDAPVKKVSATASLQEPGSRHGKKPETLLPADLPGIRQFLSAFYSRHTETQGVSGPFSAQRVMEILSTISVNEKPFLSAYLHDLEMLLNELKQELPGISMEQIRSRMLYFWSASGSFSQKELTAFLLMELSAISRKPKAELKKMLFDTAKKIQRSLSSTLILDLGSDDAGNGKAKDEMAMMKLDESVRPQHPSKPFDDFDKDETGTIYIANAGLVLLNPFIPLLFERAGLVQNRVFVDEEKQVRAVYLLQFCAGSGENNEEYRMTLPKILCGIAPDYPLANEILLNSQEKDLTNSLLENIISQWKILGGTRVEGLQQTFIARNGALRKRNDSWELDIEKRPFDMLLDKIPWTYSLIKYPWMQKPLSTLWR